MPWISESDTIIDAKGILVDSVFGLAVEGPAEDLAMEAWEADTPAKSKKLARKALAMDMDCIDALILLGMYADTEAESLALFAAAADAGERIWKDQLKSKDIVWWGHIGTRPFMRALHNLALALDHCGRTEEAKKIYLRLLKLNKEDNQGIRILLLRTLSSERDYEACQKLIKKYKSDYHLEFIMTRFWLDLIEGGSSAQAIGIIPKRNEYVLPMLQSALQTGKWPQVTHDMLAIGSEEEAASYLFEFKGCWADHEEAKNAFLSSYSKHKQE